MPARARPEPPEPANPSRLPHSAAEGVLLQEPPTATSRPPGLCGERFVAADDSTAAEDTPGHGQPLMTASFRVTAASTSIKGVEGRRWSLLGSGCQQRIGSVRRIGDPVPAQLSAASATSVCAKLRIVETSAYAVKALDESTWAAFAALVEFNNGIFGGCWCMGFHADGVGKGTTAAVNRERKLSRVRAETAHAALVFDGDDCLGWCQFGVPDELPRIKSRAAYERGRTTSPDWRIACCYVGKGHRRRGVATAALAGALHMIAGQGGGRVEGYPEDATSVPAGFLYNGALATYETLGFTRDRKIGKHRWVVTKLIEPSS